MLNQYPIWKYLVIVLVLALGALYASPNLYPDDPVVQISGASASTDVAPVILDRATDALEDAGVDYFGEELLERAAMIRFKDTETQLKAKDIIKRELGEQFVVALNLVSTTPDWLKSLGAAPMKLGLDLRGGVHFLMEVDMEKAIEQRLDGIVSNMQVKLREERLRYRRISTDLDNARITAEFHNLETRDAASNLLRSEYRNEFQYDDEEVDGKFIVEMTLQEFKLKEIQDTAITQNLTAIRNRVNELGVAEPLVQRQGIDRIVVELPGVQDTAEAKRILGRTASLEFRLEDVDGSVQDAVAGRVPPDAELFPFKDNERAPVLVQRRVIVTGEHVINAIPGYDENGQPQVNITLDGKGGQLMHRATRDHVGDRMAVIFVEHKSRFVEKQVDGETELVRQPYVEKYAINFATVQSALGSNFRITGLDSPYESSELALLLRSGALAAPMYFVEERTVGPSLGKENIESGMKSVMIGFTLVFIFMALYYRVFGLVADIALVANLVLLVSVMSIMGATLTMPGIAGIVLTVGMAVDANVLIFARIREEIRNGLTPHKAIDAGYERAFITILDANITTLIVAVILFAAGTGPVKGFAVTLSIGILTSMFTAIMGTRAMVNLIYGGRTLKTLRV